MSEIRSVVEGRDGSRTPEEVIQKALSTVRKHLGMEIAYLSEFVDGRSVFRAVDAPGLEHLIKPGDSKDLRDVYCQHILAGRLPKLIPDTGALPLAVSMPITRAAPIGSHVSVPIVKDDGEVYGMFCCLSPNPNPTLNDRDLEIMELFAGLTAEQINGAVRMRDQTQSILAGIRHVLDARDFDIVLQPIFELGSHRPSGFEALCRFRPEPYRSPDKWFAEAAAIGLGPDLEVAVIAKALELLDHLPADVYLSVNASPDTVSLGCLDEAFAGRPLERIVLEVTEHVSVEDYEGLIEETRKWRYRGVKLAIDDAGAGYSGLQHIIRLSPDILKLDMSLTSGIDSDPAKRSLAAALVHFAAESACIIVAEGIETAEEEATLASLGVHRGQGWLLGRPGPLATALALCEERQALSA